MTKYETRIRKQIKQIQYNILTQLWKLLLKKNVTFSDFRWLKALWLFGSDNSLIPGCLFVCLCACLCVSLSAPFYKNCLNGFKDTFQKRSHTFIVLLVYFSIRRQNKWCYSFHIDWKKNTHKTVALSRLHFFSDSLEIF